MTADPVKGVPSKGLKGWRDSPRLALLNLKYDAMPAGEADCLITVTVFGSAQLSNPKGARGSRGKKLHNNYLHC